uniref:Glycosyltransferase n=1 Tax=viral metagenome TaxID=1070528 RepID=A0A6C0HT03_9ZZZZ
MNVNIKNAARLGNFIIQIKNALHIALFHNYNVILPKHKFFNTTYLVINENITIENKTIEDKYSFFYKEKIKDHQLIFGKNADKVNKILREIFIFSGIESLKNDLVIHIRSGDLFQKNPHPKYLTPPLSYYKDIIERNNYENIYLISEDTLNPCINKLLALYPNIKFKLQSLEEDIKLILGASNIVISYGTFIPQLLDFSDNIKCIYVPSYLNNYKKEYFKINRDCIVKTSKLDEYYKLMIPWKNTQAQHKTMLSYQTIVK